MTAADPPHRIFLSYARADGETAAGRLGDLLREQGLGSWQDLREIGSDDTVWPQIEAALAEAQHIVVVVTEGAVTSDCVRREWRQARQSGATVSAVLGTEMSRGDLPRWLRRGEIYRLDHPGRLARLLATLRAPGRQQQAFWDDGKHLRHHVPRPGLFDEIRGQLLSDEGGPVAMTSALHGRGGFGKTTLAAMVAQDAEIRDGFIDGVFWVTLGRETTHVLGTIETLVRRMTGTPQGFTDVNSAAEHLAKLLDHRDALVIVDDVWRRSDLEPFLTATRNASLLVTTRDDTVLPRDVDPFTVDRLTAPEALELLSRGLSPDAAETVQLAAFAETFWHWAQLLAIANDILVQRVARRQTLTTALEALTKELRTAGLDAADERGLTLDAGLAISLDMLPEDTRADVERLGVFPEDVAIPLEIVSALWGRSAFTTESAAIDLERKALLAEVDLGEGTVLLHDNVLWYLRRRIGEDRLHAAQAAFLDAVRPASGAWADLSADARYLRSHLRHHLIGAGREAEWTALLTEFDWIERQLAAGGTTAMLDDYRPEPEAPPARQTGRALAMARPALEVNPRELGWQLWGRLSHLAAEECDALARAAATRQGTLRGVVSPLSPPGAEILRITGHGGPVRSAAFSPDGRWIVTGSRDGNARVWDAATGAALDLVHSDASVRCVAVQSKLVAFGDALGRLAILEVCA